MTSYTNALQIRQDGKGIPYGGTGELRADGDANYGFRNLKSDAGLIGEIPELARDDALRGLVTSLNSPASAFATVGSSSTLVADQLGHRVSGYVEIAFDSAEAVTDAANYFPVYFHFDGALHRLGFSERVHFHWELMAATFVISQVTGFTVIITINADWHTSADAAGVAWGNALDFTAMYLS